jgi:signal transduction histidine kinase
MPKGGTLCLSALCEDTPAGPSAVLLVEDEGVGIAPEDVDTIFQPFRGSFGKGTGLGLAIVHRIVTDYGGLIEVRPRPAGGTVFRVSFPERAAVHVERQAS